MFESSSSGVSLQGTINYSRLRYTKAHEEIRRPVINEYRAVRENDGVLELLRLETDNPIADRKEWEVRFPSLCKNVKSYAPRPVNLPIAVIREHEYVVVESKEEANNVASAVLNWLNEDSDIHGEGTDFIGIDMEWNAFGSDSSSQSLQVSFRDHPTYLFNLS